MSELARSRREIIKNVALAVTLGGASAEAAQHVHAMAAGDKAAGPYKAKGFTEAEFKTIQVLCELIVPGASRGNAAEFIDLLASVNPELRQRWSGGLAWMDRWMERDNKTAFAAAPPARQTALLDIIAYRKNGTGENAPGVAFFELARRMTVDAYYTSAAGIQEIGYLGNKGQSEFKVPQHIYDYAIKRSPFANG